MMITISTRGLHADYKKIITMIYELLYTTNYSMNTWNVPHESSGDNFFNCKSIFTPLVEYVQPTGINDPIPYEEHVKESNKVKYLPGEKLLIKLGKERKKNRRTREKKNNHETGIDIDRLSNSLSRVLVDF